MLEPFSEGNSVEKIDLIIYTFEKRGIIPVVVRMRNKILLSMALDGGLLISENLKK